MLRPSTTLVWLFLLVFGLIFFSPSGRAVSAELRENSAEYFYHLGALRLEEGDPALSVAYLEKSKSMSDDVRIRTLLEKARIELSKRLQHSSLDPGSYFFEKWGDEIPLSWVWMVLVAFFSLATARVLLLGRKKKVQITPSLMALFVLSLASIVWNIWMDRHPAGMLIEKVQVKTGPGDGFSNRAPLEVGVKLRLLPTESEFSDQGWIRVRFNPLGEEGFVSRSSLLLLGPESNKS